MGSLHAPAGGPAAQEGVWRWGCRRPIAGGAAEVKNQDGFPTRIKSWDPEGGEGRGASVP